LASPDSSLEPESSGPSHSLSAASPAEVTNRPEGILDAWVALEVLSPQAFRREEDLAPERNRQLVAALDRGRLPWESGGERARPNTRLFYQVVLGTLNFGAAVEELLARHVDVRIERPQARGEVVLASVTVNREGRLTEEPAVAVSSFGWGLPKALASDFASLSRWREAEERLVAGLARILRRSQHDGDDLPLDTPTLREAWEWLVEMLQLPRHLVALPRFAIRQFPYYKNPEPPEPLLLNSFFLNDLCSARAHFAGGDGTPNLRRYLGQDPPVNRCDLLADLNALEEAVAPGLSPPARWPGPGRHSLVLLQQAAVNLTFRELKEGGILAVNGPPGTGKTTLLRDLVAGNVTARAQEMASYADPVEAFSHSGQKLKAGAGWLHLYRLDPRLRGFEMVVASSNNKAVENVSAELPALRAIAEDAPDLRYLKTLSDALLGDESWGLVAAVLGNAANRGRFKKIFWWDEEVGLSTYLAEAAGTPQWVDDGLIESEGRKVRPPKIVAQEEPPKGKEEALKRWERAQAAFRNALAESRHRLGLLEQLRAQVRLLPTLADAEERAQAAFQAARTETERSNLATRERRANADAKKVRLDEATSALRTHERAVPSLWARLFSSRRARAWRDERSARLAMLRERTSQHAEAVRELAQAEALLRAAGERQGHAEVQWNGARERHQEARRMVEQARNRLGSSLLDKNFFACSPEERQLIVPWMGRTEQRARDDTFIAAVALQRAFLDAAAKPIRQNLGALMTALSGASLRTTEKRALLPDLWSTFFLVVPLVSTTFASIERMFVGLPAESLGWLFIDEAGQASPQAAVGALLRTQRAVVVGDPMQIEPIVTLPQTLTAAICRSFGVDPDLYNAPDASTQTLADAATPFVAEFQTPSGSRSVGIPLLVHRRCTEPMFGIANSVAYGRQMVQAKKPAPTRIGEILGPSRWIHVEGPAEEKWCPEEGEVALCLLRRLADVGISPDLFLVTPFVVVADNLRRLVREDALTARWTEDSRAWARDRVGTIHTVQGREAEAVIFVLGAPAPQQTGARNWAGGRPNLINVAVTRAKERLYVIGNRDLWRQAGLFAKLADGLPASDT
jgi:ABC-type branched-subunit amino acid transport system ATPase component